MSIRTGELIGGVRITQKLPKPEMSIRTRSVALTKLKRGRRGLNAKDNKTRAQAMPSLAETRDAQRRTRGVASITPSASSTPAEVLRGARLPALQAPCVPPRRWRAAKPSGAHQHAHPACRDPGGSAACAVPCPRASERSPVKFGRQCAQWCNLPWRPRNFARPACGPRRVRCGGRAHALDRTNCQAGVWLAFG